MAATTASGEWPAMAPVSPRAKSTYSRPSTSVTRAPLARARARGNPPAQFAIQVMGTPVNRCSARANWPNDPGCSSRYRLRSAVSNEVSWDRSMQSFRPERNPAVATSLPGIRYPGNAATWELRCSGPRYPLRSSVDQEVFTCSAFVRQRLDQSCDRFVPTGLPRLRHGLASELAVPGEVPPPGHVAVLVALVGQQDVEPCGLPCRIVGAQPRRSVGCGGDHLGALLHLVGELTVEIPGDVAADGLQRATGQRLAVRHPPFPLALEAARPQALRGVVDVAGGHPEPQATFDAFSGLLLGLLGDVRRSASVCLVGGGTGQALLGKSAAPLGGPIGWDRRARRRGGRCRFDRPGRVRCVALGRKDVACGAGDGGSEVRGGPLALPDGHGCRSRGGKAGDRHIEAGGQRNGLGA